MMKSLITIFVYINFHSLFCSTILEDITIETSEYQGVRINIGSDDNITEFYFWANINEPLLIPNNAKIKLGTFETTYGEWIIDDEELRLGRDDVVFYMAVIRKNDGSSYTRRHRFKVQEITPFLKQHKSRETTVVSVTPAVTTEVSQSQSTGNFTHSLSVATATTSTTETTPVVTVTSTSQVTKVATSIPIHGNTTSPSGVTDNTTSINVSHTLTSGTTPSTNTISAFTNKTSDKFQSSTEPVTNVVTSVTPKSWPTVQNYTAIPNSTTEATTTTAAATKPYVSPGTTKTLPATNTSIAVTPVTTTQTSTTTTTTTTKPTTTTTTRATTIYTRAKCTHNIIMESNNLYFNFYGNNDISHINPDTLSEFTLNSCSASYTIDNGNLNYMDIHIFRPLQNGGSRQSQCPRKNAINTNSFSLDFYGDIVLDNVNFDQISQLTINDCSVSYQYATGVSFATTLDLHVF